MKNETLQVVLRATNKLAGKPPCAPWLGWRDRDELIRQVFELIEKGENPAGGASC